MNSNAVRINKKCFKIYLVVVLNIILMKNFEFKGFIKSVMPEQQFRIYL
jgi:hypothetical protein